MWLLRPKACIIAQKSQFLLRLFIILFTALLNLKIILNLLLLQNLCRAVKENILYDSVGISI